jgi:23S rRNA pseudouridine2605 synthase
MDNKDKIRVQKIIADAGLASRRKAEELIEKGAVTVNGQRCHLGDKADPAKDKIVVAGREIRLRKDAKKYYIMLHKPRGFITTMSDEGGRKCVAELVDEVPARLFPVGRLDKDSEGMLLMTNDGDFANMISHPSTHFAKTYRVTVHPHITEEQLTALTTGVVIDGRKSMPASVRVVTSEKERTVLEIVLEEGRNRQIRKMCEAIGLEVARLKRTAIGPVKLGMLQPGKFRELTADEMRAIRAYQTKLQARKSKN